MKPVLLVAFAFSLAVLPPAIASHEGCNGDVTELATPAVTFYVDARDVNNPTGDTWVYMETNGEAGLQSGGEQYLGLWVDECTHLVPDQLLY